MLRHAGIVTILLFSLAPTRVHAQQPFEAVITGDDCQVILVYQPYLQWINPDRLEAGLVIGIASGDHRRVFGIVNSSTGEIAELRPDGTRIPFFTLGSTSNRLAVAGDGRVFVRAIVSGVHSLAVISAEGVLETTWPLPPATGAPFAVGADSCTIYLASGSTIRRMNGCTGAALSDLPTGAGPIRDIEPLRNGQLLIAHGVNADLYDSAGNYIRRVASLGTYGFDELAYEVGQVAATADLTSVSLTASTCELPGSLLTVSFANGAELSRQDAINRPYDLVLGAAAAASIPAASESALLLLALGIAAAALFVLKGR